MPGSGASSAGQSRRCLESMRSLHRGWELEATRTVSIVNCSAVLVLPMDAALWKSNGSLMVHYTDDAQPGKSDPAICTDILHSPARVLVIQAAMGSTGDSDADPGHG